MTPIRPLLRRGIEAAFAGPDALLEFRTQHNPSSTLLDLLQEITTTFRNAADALVWMARAVPALEGRSATEAVEQGDVERVTDMLRALNLGITGQPRPRPRERRRAIPAR